MKILSRILLAILIILIVLGVGAGFYFQSFAQKHIQQWLTAHYGEDLKVKSLGYVIPGIIIGEDVTLVGRFHAQKIRIAFPKKSLDIIAKGLKDQLPFINVPAKLWVQNLRLEKPLALDNDKMKFLAAVNKDVDLETDLILEFARKDFELVKIQFEGQLITDFALMPKPSETSK